MSLTASSKDKLYTASAGSLIQNGSALTLTMPAENITVAQSGDTYYTKSENNSANAGYDNEGAVNLFDRNTETKWCGTTKDSTPFVIFRTATMVIPKGYILTTANDTAKNPGRNPIAWTLEGSDNGQSWVKLTEVSDNRTLEAANFTSYAFSLTSPATDAYSFFRFTIKGISDGTTFQLSELQLVVSDTGEESPEGPEPYKDYNLWLGSTRVNSTNKDDILNDGGKAKFDPKTNTLTLDNPQISGTYNNNNFPAKIHSAGMDLIVKGSYHMTAYEGGNNSYGIDVYQGTLTLAGDFTFMGEYKGVCATNDLTIASGKLVAKAKIQTAITSAWGKIIFCADIESVEATNETFSAVSAESAELDYHLYVAETNDGKWWFRNAQYVLIKRATFYHLTFNMNGHGTAVDELEVKQNEKASKPDDPSAEGATFGGWYTEKECKNAYDFDTPVTSDLTLYAKWTVKEYSITIVADNGTAAKYKEDRKYKHGEEYTLPECIFAAPEDRVFYYWDKGKVGEKITITSDTVIKAVWRDFFKLGDVDGDGNITIFDASLIQKKIAGQKPDPFNDLVADVDGDGEITIFDASAIQKYIAGMPVPYDIGKPV